MNMSTESAKVDGRRERSRKTKTRIAGEAGRLFVQRGYPATTIAAIAEAAGVAQPTVYASFGTKASVLAAALDLAIAGDDAPVSVNERPWMQPVWKAGTAAERLQAYAAAVRRIHAGAGDMFAVVAAAAAVDPDAAELAAVAEDRRRLGATAVIDAVLEVGPLRPELDRDLAIDVLTLFNSPGTFEHLVRRRRWTFDHYERWLAGALVRELLDHP